ncbi:MAG: zinc-dependent peptidase [Cyclobacteriaceae bacterium]|nr:zinc-dependent peptidase [Cyclobacteriaceae bacterium HetDA_MAG_MS6]
MSLQIVFLTLLGLTIVIGGHFVKLFFYEYLPGKRYFSSGLSYRRREILKKYFPFYNLLPPESKKIFENRIRLFIARKNFVPRGLSHVTREMRVLISAAAIQTTFGLPKIYLTHFQNILVYPDEYYSHITKKYHKGEVNPRHGVIVLSWKAFVEGYIENEGVNLGLHEMAHALHLENRIRNDEYAFLPAEALQKWDLMMQKEVELIKNGEHPLFRSYGAVDKFEFFAVAVENFFEKPVEFERYSHDLYFTMAELLQQNPLLLLKSNKS